MENKEIAQVLSDINKESIRIFWDSTINYFYENHFWIISVIGIIICAIIIFNIKNAIETKTLISEQNNLLERLLKQINSRNDSTIVDTSKIDDIKNDISLNNPEILDTLLKKLDKDQ